MIMRSLRFASCAARKAVGFVILLSAVASQAMALPPPTPEIDAGSMAGAIAMLALGAMMLADRVSRKKVLC